MKYLLIIFIIFFSGCSSKTILKQIPSEDIDRTPIELSFSKDLSKEEILNSLSKELLKHSIYPPETIFPICYDKGGNNFCRHHSKGLKILFNSERMYIVYVNGLTNIASCDAIINLKYIFEEKETVNSLKIYPISNILIKNTFSQFANEKPIDSIDNLKKDVNKIIDNIDKTIVLKNVVFIEKRITNKSYEENLELIKPFLKEENSNLYFVSSKGKFLFSTYFSTENNLNYIELKIIVPNNHFNGATSTFNQKDIEIIEEEFKDKIKQI